MRDAFPINSRHHQSCADLITSKVESSLVVIQAQSVYSRSSCGCECRSGQRDPRLTCPIRICSSDCHMCSRIEDYALIGDCETCALVGRNGSIDWLCFPRFDSPSCFAALLGTPENGHWRIAPRDADAVSSRHYRGDTLVLETEWSTSTGSVRVIDFMPPRDEAPDVVRIVEG